MRVPAARPHRTLLNRAIDLQPAVRETKSMLASAQVAKALWDSNGTDRLKSLASFRL